MSLLFQGEPGLLNNSQEQWTQACTLLFHAVMFLGETNRTFPKFLWWSTATPQAATACEPLLCLNVCLHFDAHLLRKETMISTLLFAQFILREYLATTFTKTLKDFMNFVEQQTRGRKQAMGVVDNLGHIQRVDTVMRSNFHWFSQNGTHTEQHREPAHSSSTKIVFT